MAGRSDTQPGNGHKEMMGAFRDLYKAISQVSHEMSSLPIPDEELLPLLITMDSLNSAFSNVRNIYCQMTRHERKPDIGTDNVLLSQRSSFNVGLSLEEKVSLLQKENVDLKRSIAAVTGDTLTVMSNGKNELEKQLENSQRNVTDVASLQLLLNDLHITSQNRKEMNDKVGKLEADMKNKTDRMDLLEALVLDLHQEHIKPVIAFYAQTIKTTRMYRPGDSIEFLNVLENSSGCYDAPTSTFTAPKNGLYFFATSVNVNTAKFFTAVITVNDQDQLAYFGTPPTADLQSSTCALKSLSKGDKVCVKVYTSSSPLGVQPGACFSNFVGFIIQ